jgi:hypothetical protein
LKKVKPNSLLNFNLTIIMILNFLKEAVFGLVVGLIGGPLVAGLVGVLLISLTWLVLGLSEQLPWATAFGMLVAPIGGYIGVFVGSIVGGFGQRFGSLANVATFGGIVGATVGLFTAPLFFGANAQFSAVLVAVITLTITGVATAVAVKYLQRRFAKDTAQV